MGNLPENCNDNCKRNEKSFKNESNAHLLHHDFPQVIFIMVVLILLIIVQASRTLYRQYEVVTKQGN